MNTHSPILAAALSFLVPGLGQLYNGQRAKALSVLCMDLGIGCGIYLALWGPERLRSVVSALALGIVYLFVLIPAVIDARQQALGSDKPILSGQKVWYVIFMLLTVGPGAIPLLWQSIRFSMVAKAIWTLAIILIFVGGILLMLYVMPPLEKYYKLLFEATYAF